MKKHLVDEQKVDSVSTDNDSASTDNDHSSISKSSMDKSYLLNKDQINEYERIENRLRKKYCHLENFVNEETPRNQIS